MDEGSNEEAGSSRAWLCASLTGGSSRETAFSAVPEILYNIKNLIFNELYVLDDLDIKHSC